MQVALLTEMTETYTILAWEPSVAQGGGVIVSPNDYPRFMVYMI